MNSLAFFAMLLYFIIYSLGAPIQYVASLIGVQSLVTFSKVALPGILILLGLVKIFLRMEINKKVFSLTLLVIMSLLIAYFSRLPLVQIVYGLKTFMPFFGVYFYFFYFYKKKKDFKFLYRLMIPVTFLGLFVDKFIDFPWSNISIEVGGIEREISRSWETFGVERLAGFQTASYDSAILIVILITLFGISTFNKAEKSKKIRLYDSFLFLLGIYSIYLTTFKSAYVFIFVYLCFGLLKKYYNKTTQREKKFAGFLMKLTLLCLFLYSLIPPILSIMGINFFSKVGQSSNFMSNYLFKSYGIRMMHTWPDALKLLDLASFSGWFGRGIGGVGTAQQYAEPLVYNAGDNFFLFIFITFGVLAIPLVLALLKLLLKMNFTENNWFIMGCLLLIIFTFGATINFIDSPFLMSISGALLALYTNFYYNKLLKNNS